MQNGGLLGKKVEPVVVDPASNWPLFAEKARELISKDKVAAVFGCWTSVSRKSVLPVFEELNGLLFYPLEYEGEESSYNIFYGSSVPDNKAIPAVEYLMSKDGGEVKRFILEGTDYVYPRTSNKIIRAFLKSKGVKDEDIMENYTPFGFSDWQTEVAAIKKFGSAGKKTAVISTINGDANVPFYKELANQGVKASDIPVIAFSVGEEELAGLDTKPLVGHLAAWSYFESVNTPENKAFIAKWHAYTHDNKRVTNDPMEFGLHPVPHVGAGGAAGRHDRRRCRAPGDDRTEGQVAVGLRGDDAAQSPHGEAGDDRRSPGQRAVRHRLSRARRCRRRHGAPTSKPTRARSPIGRGRGPAAAARRRNTRPSSALEPEHRAQRPGDGADPPPPGRTFLRGAPATGDSDRPTPGRTVVRRRRRPDTPRRQLTCHRTGSTRTAHSALRGCGLGRRCFGGRRFTCRDQIGTQLAQRLNT